MSVSLVAFWACSLLNLAREQRKNTLFLGNMARSMQRACGQSCGARADAS